jgi:hypothetical protein
MHTLLYIINMPLTQVPNSLIYSVSTNNIAPAAGAITISSNGALATDLFCTPTLNTVSLSAATIITSRLKMNFDTSSAIFNNTNEFGFGVDTTLSRYAGTFGFNWRIIHSNISFRSIPRAPVSRVVYNFTGANQTFTVPAGVRYIYAKLWGAGGGAGRPGNWSYGSDGGGGGHTRGIIPVTPGEVLNLIVGRGGYTTNGFPALRYGGGGGANNATNLYAGDGGGYAAIFGRGGASALTVDVLVVAGGGGGGSDMGGGGGGGGVLEYNNVAIAPNVYSITVGAGGAGAAAGTSQARGSNGGNSSALGYTAIGGGGGASTHNNANSPASNGGSGGGGSGGRASRADYGGSPGTGTAGQGFDGAASGVTWYPGGGGGAGGPGSNTPGTGGPGKISTILGTSYYWGGGGGGSGYSAVGGNGGLGGGGGGAVLTTTGGTGGINNGAAGGGGAINSQCNTPGGAGGANTGGGGGGGSHYNSNNYGGAGGSGMVIIRYLGGQRAYGGDSVYQTTIGGQVYTIHQFTSTTTSNFAVDPMLVVGGGGGGGSSRTLGQGQAGGAGGGWDGCGGESAYDNKWNYSGTGGSTGANVGGSSPVTGGITTGTRFQGGNASVNDHGGGGGGGWWGGGGGTYSESNTMGAGGGGSGYVAGYCITGETYKGCRRFPAYFWDEDLEQSVVTGASYGQGICGYGGKDCVNNLPANVPSGGHAKIVIYY